MASPDHPDTPPAPDAAPTGIQASPGVTPPPEPTSISLPPPQAPATGAGREVDPEAFLRLRGQLDAALVALVLALAFLVASFPATNSDFFRQLATGRLVLRGEYAFGSDPFVYTGEDVYWVNHSWLFAVLAYGLYHLGGAAVVVAKALLVALLAEVLLRTGRRQGQSLWIPAACTGLAVLALSPRLLLQPTLFSFLFLGVTLWLLTAGRRPDSRLWWLLPPLFALWANCDEWFFLAPLTAALYLLGEWLERLLPLADAGPDAGRADLRALGLAVAVGAAACLLNPHHVRVFQLPPELGLSAAGDLLENEPQFRALFLSPLHKDYYDPARGLSAAGLAFWPLLAAGLASFAFLSGRAPWWRLTVWLPLSLLALYSARAVPFFAVVAAPITALNWLDVSARRLGREPRLTPGWRFGSLGGRALTALAGLALLLAAVPGWLQAWPYEPRRVGWRVRPDPALEAMARTVSDWRQQGKLTDAPHWYNTQPEVANYLAWFAPGERAFLDPALPHFRETAEDYAAVRDGLEETFGGRAAAEGAAGPGRTAKDWRRVLRRRGVRFWVLDNVGAVKGDVALFADPDEWVICHLYGRVAVFAWRDPQAAGGDDPSRGLALDLKGLAFGPDARQAPPKGPGPVSPPPNVWELWWRPAPEPSPERDTAVLHQLRFLAQQPRYARGHFRAYQRATDAAAIALAAPCGPGPNFLLALSWACAYHDLMPAGSTKLEREPEGPERVALAAVDAYVRNQDVGPPDALYLGVRAARRALRDHRDDAQTYYTLGHLYSRLSEQTHERLLLPPLAAQLRRTQLVAAYHNCLLCLRARPNPRLEREVHLALARQYRQLGYLDAGVHHVRELHKLREQIGPLPGDSPDAFDKEQKQIARELSQLEDRLQRARNEYEVASAGRPALEKVALAMEKGLAETALSALEQAAPREVGPNEAEVVRRTMGLLLDLGRVEQARDLLIPEPEKTAGQPVPPHYLELHLRLAAAEGDYEEVDRLLADTLAYAWKSPQGATSNTADSLAVAVAVGRVLLAEARHLGGELGGAPRLPLFVLKPRGKERWLWLNQMPSEFWVRRWQLEALGGGASVQERRAEWHALRGWVALEAGRCTEALRDFRAARADATPLERWMRDANELDAFFDPRGDPVGQMLQGLVLQQAADDQFVAYFLRRLEGARR